MDKMLLVAKWQHFILAKSMLYKIVNFSLKNFLIIAVLVAIMQLEKCGFN